MGVCLCCLRRGAFTCYCQPEWCRGGYGLCVKHCRCFAQSLHQVGERLAAVDPEGGLDDPSGPFADLPDEPQRVEDRNDR